MYQTQIPFTKDVDCSTNGNKIYWKIKVKFQWFTVSYEMSAAFGW